MRPSRRPTLRRWATAGAALLAASVLAVATGPVAQAVDLAPVDFGIVELGTTALVPVQITLAGAEVVSQLLVSDPKVDGIPQSGPSAFAATAGTCTSAGPVTCELSVSFAPGILGVHTASLSVVICGSGPGPVSCGGAYTVQLSGTGTTPTTALSPFEQPVDNDAVNSARAGATIPLKFSVTRGGAPVTDLTLSNLTVTSAGGVCGTGPVDAIETYSGASGLQNLGGGSYQYNWKTPKTYQGQCRTISVGVVGAVRTADFAFS